MSQPQSAASCILKFSTGLWRSDAFRWLEGSSPGRSRGILPLHVSGAWEAAEVEDISSRHVQSKIVFLK